MLSYIMFSDKVDLNSLVLSGVKTNERKPLNTGLKMTRVEFSFFLTEFFDTRVEIDETHGYVYDKEDRLLSKLNLPYYIGQEVPILRAYKEFVPNHPQEEWVRKSIAKRHRFDDENIENIYGWDNKLFTSTRLMEKAIRIKKVDIVRLQEITDEECLRCGVVNAQDYGFGMKCIRPKYKVMKFKRLFNKPKDAFRFLMTKRWGPRIWNQNPFVYSIDFEVVTTIPDWEEHYKKITPKEI